MDSLSRLPLYLQVKNYITSMIDSGDYPADSKLPTEKELMKTLFQIVCMICSDQLDALDSGCLLCQLSGLRDKTFRYLFLKYTVLRFHFIADKCFLSHHDRLRICLTDAL